MNVFSVIASATTVLSFALSMRMRDTARPDGFDHEGRNSVELKPDQMLVIDYRPESGEFIFR